MQGDATDEAEFALVYTGFDQIEAGLFARLLEAEGITCRHLGSQHPAAFGVGEFACEQRLEVPAAEAARARELIDAAREAPGEPAEEVSE